MQKEKIEQQEKEFKENFISDSDRILSQGELIEEQREELKQLTVRIEDVETLLDEVSSEAYDKAVEKVAKEAMLATRRDDIRLAEDSKKWIQDPKHKASRREKEYAIKRLDGLIQKIETAMEKIVIRITSQLKQPEKKRAVVEEIKKEVKPSIREKEARTYFDQLWAEAMEIYWSVEDKNSLLRFSKDNVITYRWIISDTGIGISKEFLKHIFEPFAQERSDARSVYHGTGLGMAIVKKMIDKMGGTISVTSEVGKGSTFVIELSFEMASEPEKSKKEEAEKENSIRGLNLMLVEDNELNAEIAEMLLKYEGAIITMANDGQQAVGLFNNNPVGTFDAILMDIMMPVMDGLTATKAIRALNRPDAGTVPIIAMTANVFEEDVQKCLAAGMNAHLVKPLDIEKVKKTICEQTKNSKWL